MSLHQETFFYLKPTAKQIDQMDVLRKSFASFADLLDVALPEGPDKTYILRKFREVAMWVNIAITRHPDGAPRDPVGDKPQPDLVSSKS